MRKPSSAAGESGIIALETIRQTLMSGKSLRKLSEIVGCEHVPGQAWLILAIAVLLQAIVFPLQLFGGLAVPVLHRDLADGGEFGWSLGSVGLAIAAFFLVGGLARPICQALTDRLGRRAMLLALALLYGAGMILMGLAIHQWHFFLAYSVMLALAFSASTTAVTGLTGPWFEHRPALAIALVWAGGAVGAALLTPAMAFLLNAWGGAGCFVAFGLVGGGLLLTLAVLYRNPAGDPSPVDRAETGVRAQLSAAHRQFIRRQIRKTHCYYKLPIIRGLGCGTQVVMLAFMVDFIVAQGFPLLTGALALAVAMLCWLPGRIMIPVIAEQSGGRLAISGTLALQGLSVLALLFADGWWGLFFAAAMFGFAYGGEAIAYSVITRQYFGDLQRAHLHGWQSCGALAGQSLALVAAALAIHYFGHAAGFLIAVALSLVGAMLIWNIEGTRFALVTEDGEMPVGVHTCVVVRITRYLSQQSPPTR